jgi:uncharacterized protein
MQSGIKTLTDKHYSHFMQAIKAKDVSRLAELLKSVKNVDTLTDKSEESVLFRAAEVGFEEGVKQLLKAGADPNRGLESAIFPAIRGGQIEIVKLLIERRANVNAHNELGDTPLLVAVEHGPIEIVQMLLDAGADPNKPNFERSIRPLIAAVSRGDAEIVKALVKADAWVNSSHYDTEGQEPAMIQAAMLGYGEIVEVLRLKASPDDVKLLRLLQDHGWKRENGEILRQFRKQLLVNYKVAIEHLKKIDGLDICDKSGTTPLMEAANLGSKDAVVDLIRLGAKPDWVSPYGGESAASYAALGGHAELFEFLLPFVPKAARRRANTVKNQMIKMNKWKE